MQPRCCSWSSSSTYPRLRGGTAHPSRGLALLLPDEASDAQGQFLRPGRLCLLRLRSSSVCLSIQHLLLDAHSSSLFGPGLFCTCADNVFQFRSPALSYTWCSIVMPARLSANRGVSISSTRAKAHNSLLPRVHDRSRCGLVLRCLARDELQALKLGSLCVFHHNSTDSNASTFRQRLMWPSERSEMQSGATSAGIG
jgi:hypothetical protein